MRNRVGQSGAIQNSTRQLLRQVHNQIQAWTNQVVLYRREAVLYHTPLRCQRGRVPGVVDVAERELLALGQIVIDAEQLFAPVGGWRNRSNVTARG